MKKIMFAAFVLLGLQATAQVKFGAKVGLLSANQSLSMGGEDFSSKLGLNVGLVTDISLSKSISLQSGVGFNSRGTRELHNGHYDNFVVNTLEIPLNVVYKIPVGVGKIIVGAGPNVGFNLSAKIKEHEAPDEKVEIGNGIDQLKALDLGANFVAGFEINKCLFVQLNYNLGLSNLSNIPNFTQKNKMLGLTLGYFFGK